MLMIQYQHDTGYKVPILPSFSPHEIRKGRYKAKHDMGFPYSLVLVLSINNNDSEISNTDLTNGCPFFSCGCSWPISAGTMNLLHTL